ncbi:chondroitin sulfate proteoglycan 4 [Corythoichthys intestinalis]|uniref:chondroitin sulfate proteoglycan 4 n=1 Tax=Corythoichthys intestinalis TaxID=161448 RepID=UPI0025A605FB|nr:chondroitin sulfate proteoglycan 4 [Corythoichthys intestinalis]XP_061803868.1 chondroitin sulfate proteoglycan 4-like [Nerophis lumbriciformis]
MFSFGKKLLILWVAGLLWCSLLVEFASGASFYGDGFVQLKATESSDHNKLRVRFRTSSTDGLLFLAGSQSAYFLLELNAARLQLKLDFGSGEQVLQSDRATQLNDLAWHSVDIIHFKRNVNLTVDKNSHTSAKIPGSHHVLNILDGIYVGGSGGLDRLYLPRDQTSFRGCMEDVIFNEHDLLSSLRPYTGFKTVHEVSLGCSPQFFATEADPVSFFSSRAYISLPLLNGQQETVFECAVHTSASEGIVLYYSAKEGDFAALEIKDGSLVAIVGRGGSKIELRSLTFINDRKWHAIKMRLNSKTLELTVDGENVKSSVGSRSKGLQFKGYAFIGGIDDSTRSEVRKVGLVSLSGKRMRGGSFKGCMKNIQANGVKVGLVNAIVTKDISVGCEPEKEPALLTTASPTNALESLFFLVTPTPSLHMSTLARGLDRRYGSNFVRLKPLTVEEGGRASLDAKHIKILLDFKTLGIRQSQIVFQIQDQPIRGQIRLDVDPDQPQNTFSMLDLWHERVMYIHGGSEDPDDFFTFSIFSSSRKEVPEYLKGEKLYRFNITVTPTNDAPELSLPEGNLFVLLENSKKRLTTDVLKATDIDSNYSNLVFTVLGNLNADAGYLELENNPGTSVTSFFHSDLQESRVYYVHTGVKNSRIVLRVSDGEKVSNTVVLRVIAVALEYKIANNTGLNISQGEMAVIGSEQLSVETNAVKQLIDIRYDVTEQPQYGELQRLHSSGEWRPIDSFSQRLLEKGRLRYVSTYHEIQTSNVSDHFKCKVHVAARATTEILFPITVQWVQYNLVRNVVINLDKARKATLDSEHLLAVAKGVIVPDEDLYFRVLTTPKKGKLLLDTTVLAKNSTFSQRDVTDQKVHYELVDRPHEDTHDRFKFHLFSKHAQSQNYDFQFAIKADVNNVFIRLAGLLLQEGESKLITKNELFAETLLTQDMYYTVISSPKHGKLARITQSNSNSSYDNILTFSNQDLLEDRILYVHDDSETIQDEFTFIASTTRGFKSFVAEDEIGSKEGTFNISIQLVNDQKPVRVIDKVFHVVREGQRLLTVDDLLYHDPDSDFDDGQLIYIRRGIPLGDLVLANDTSHRLFEFRQKDLEDKKVLFIHRGASVGRFVLFVSDGKNFVSSLLDINAQEPFLKVANNTGLMVQKGQSVSISASNFTVTSNLDVRSDEEVAIKLNDTPKHGRLYRDEIAVESFTLSDLKNGFISYRHDDSKQLSDHFDLTVTAKDINLVARINVKVYLESHQRPPILQHRNNLLVEEGKPVKIDETKLEVTHEDNVPSEIVFTVKAGPYHGFLRHFVEPDERYVGSEESPVKTFTQKDVNSGNIQYVQVEPDKVNDTFILEATNGVTDVGDISILIDIVPRLIPLQVSNFTVDEGGYKALTMEILEVKNRHFTGINFLFNVTEPPNHGHIEHSRHPGVPLTSFTRRQVEHEFIYYVHDSSETLEDNFTVVANDTGLRKQSDARTVFIQVTAVNDEPPVITANRVLRVWVSSVTEISLDDLRAQDLDTPPEELHFSVTPPSNGHLALKSAPMTAVLNFTQAHIDQGQLLFVHKGAMSGGLNFQVNDGVNYTPRQIFSITARALVLNLLKNRPLKVFPGSSTPVTNEDLQVMTNDVSGTSNRTITFSVIRHPKMGRLVRKLSENSSVDISSFTQDMVDRKEVLYIQTPIESVGWEAMDSLTFSVASPPSSLESQTFKIDISYENTGPEQRTVLLANTGAEVTEGESVIIDKSKLDATNLMSKLPLPQRSANEVWFQVTSLPRHGVIVVGERNLTEEKPNFSQFIINKYGITYKHDNSETTRDSFAFSAWVNPKGKTAQRPVDDIDVVEDFFNITVAPVNDQPPVLKTKAPSLTVVQGDTVAIKTENLKVEDMDNPPDDIVFSVISKPNDGYLALIGRLNESISTFTQAQINNGSVYFIHDGSPTSGVFYFSVTDGHHKPIYKLFNLDVTKFTISLVNHTGLTLEQGSTAVWLNQDNLSAKTNGRNTTIHYQVTRPPKFGKLLLNNQEVSQFEQNDIQNGHLAYHMTNLSSPEDSFEFSAFTSEADLKAQVLNITVSPLIQFGKSVRMPSGISVKLTSASLDASKLADICSCDPVFEIISHPVYGKAVRPKAKKWRKSEPVESFTFLDVTQEKIALELKANMTGVEELNDSLVFFLKADSIQPARGEFHFTIVPLAEKNPLATTLSPSQTTIQTSGNGTSSPERSTAVVHTQQPSKNQQRFKGRNRWGKSNRTSIFSTTLGKPTAGTDYFPFLNTPVRVESYPQKSSSPLLVILPLLALLLLVIIFVVLVVFLRHHRRRKQRTPKEAPPAGFPDGYSYQGQTQRSATVPTVTVTPLNPTSTGSPALSHLLVRNQQSYNYNGVDSNILISSWSSDSPTTSLRMIQTPTPSLQRNQYWV